MLPPSEVAARVAALYEGRALQGYVRWKVRTDPAYQAVLERLRSFADPVVDVGCGVGVLPLFLRENGWNGSLVGLDFDERKIAVARQAATRYRGIDFITAEASGPLPVGHNVVILDVLQYCSPAEQRLILQNARDAVPPDGVVIIRQGIRDSSWRHRLTTVVDQSARTLRWMRGRRLYYPSREEVIEPFAGFEVEVRPLWGRMPYNNYLFVFRRRT